MKCKACDGTGTSNWCINGTFKTCEYCNGTGQVQERTKIRCDDCKFEPDCVDYGWEGCKKFTPNEPPHNQTNFSEITETPEKLAEFIHTVTQQCHECGATGRVKVKGCAVRQTFAPNLLFLPCVDKPSTEYWLKEKCT